MFRCKSQVFTGLFAVVLSASQLHGWQIQLQEPREKTDRIAVAPHFSVAPTIDGKIATNEWKAAPLLDSFGQAGGSAGAQSDEAEADVKTTVRTGFDDQFLYVAVDCEEPLLEHAELRAQAGEDAWPGDAVAIYIDFGRQRRSFRHLATNVLGAHFDAIDGGRWWDGDWQVKTAKTARGWSAEFAIPWSDFALSGKPGEMLMGFNVVRFRSINAIGEKPAIQAVSAWQSSSDVDDAHHFGELFVGRPSASTSYIPTVRFDAFLDRYEYNQYQPFAQLAVDLSMGQPRNISLKLQLTEGASQQVVEQTEFQIESSRRTALLPIDQLNEGSYTLTMQGVDNRGETSRPVSLPLRIVRTPSVARAGEIRLTQTQPINRSATRWHMRTAVALPEGALFNLNHVQLADSSGTVIPLQTRTLATWGPKGSIKWLGLDFQQPIQVGKKDELVFRYSSELNNVEVGKLRVRESSDHINIDTGIAHYRIRKHGFNFIDQITQDGRQLLTADATAGPFMCDDQGTAYFAANDRDSTVIIEEDGPLKTVIRAEGWHISSTGNRLGKYVVRLYFFSGLAHVRAQHTFILAEDTNKTRYSDIGLRLPVAGTDYHFAEHAGDLAANTSVCLLQKRWDQYIVWNQAGKEIASGEKAAGLIARGPIAVTIQDFWQNFPTQLEASRDALTLHYWPRVGAVVWSPEQEVLPESAYLLPFVHQGDVLDFKVPQRYFDGPLSQEYGFSYIKDGKWQLHYGKGAAESLAMGLAKTQNLLISIGEAAKPEPAVQANAIFQNPPQYLPAPQAVADSLAVEEFTPVDDDFFPRQEKYLSEGFDFLMRWTLDATHAYGKFNYGDAYHVFKRNSPDLMPGYYRLWAGYHHGRARMPWLLYLRSGDPKYLAWGRANAQHLIDIDTCHYATREAMYRGGADQKLVGGMNDYKGYVHWHTGYRTGYNSMLDFAQLSYYLTGDNRMVDVVHASGKLLAKNAIGKSQRHAACLGALLDYYKFTWNPDAMVRFRQQLPRVYRDPLSEHSPPSEQWGRTLEPWINYSADSDAVAFLMQGADQLLKISETPFGRQFYGDGRVLAMAYKLTGDRKYLDHAWGYYNAGPGFYEDPDHPRHHETDWLNWSFEGQQMLPVMAHLKKLGTSPRLDQPHYLGLGGVKVWMRTGKIHGQVRFELFEQSDQPFTVGINRMFSRKPLEYELISPAGNVVQRGNLPSSGQGLRGFQIEQPADGTTGVYILRVFGPDEYKIETSNICSLKTQRLLIEPLTNEGELLVDGRWFLYVPTESEQVRFTVRPNRNWERLARLEVTSPEDRIVSHSSLATGSDEQVVTIDVPAKWRGKVWSIAAADMPLIAIDGAPSWLAATYEGALPRKD